MTTPLQDPAAFGPADRALFDAIARHDQGLRALLCTLARHGVALRRDASARAAAWLDALAPHPYFKGGQFLFDLLEWEDFMLDGEVPAALDVNALRGALDRVAAALRTVGAQLDGSATPVTVDISAGAAGEELPPLAASRYLYHDVVLGAVALVAMQPRA